MKPFLLPMILATILTACSPSSNESGTQTASQESAQPKKVAITAIVDHPALNDIRQGILDQLKEEGFEENNTMIVDFQSAQGNPSTAAQIAKKFVGDYPDLIIPISTPSAQAVVAATKDIPVLYAGVTDPIAAKLVPSWEPSSTNVTGMSNQMTLTSVAELIQEILPKVKKIGYVYSPGEVNSVAMLGHLQDAVKPFGFEIVEAPAQTTSEVLTAARSLKGKVDVIFTGHDNNVVAAYPSMYKAAVEMQIPLVAADSNSVSKGAAVALGVNDYDLGRQAGRMAASILNGQQAGAIPSQRMSDLELVVSTKHAKDQGLELPESVLSRALKKID